MQAYSQDLRQRVLHAIDAGQRQAVVAQTFSVSIATIKRYRHRNDEKEGMCCPNRSLVGPASKERLYKLASSNS